MKKYIAASIESAFVGIWWYTDDGHVWGQQVPLDNAVLDGPYYQSSLTDNHSNLWKTTVNDNVPDVKARKDIYELGYKGLERGRVMYDARSRCFIITCSKELAHNMDALKCIVNAYGLNGCRVDVETSNHYNKLPITGNPAVDKFNYFGDM